MNGCYTIRPTKDDMTQEQETPRTIEWEPAGMRRVDVKGADSFEGRESLRAQFLTQAFLAGIGASYSSDDVKHLSEHAARDIAHQLRHFVAAVNQLNKKVHEFKNEHRAAYNYFRQPVDHPDIDAGTKWHELVFEGNTVVQKARNLLMPLKKAEIVKETELNAPYALVSKMNQQSAREAEDMAARFTEAANKIMDVLRFEEHPSEKLNLLKAAANSAKAEGMARGKSSSGKAGGKWSGNAA